VSGDLTRLSGAHTGLFFDFDGTLSEIAPNPWEARPVTGVPEVLGDLARTYRVVAVVSGRRAREVAGLLGPPPGVRCFGLYGLEDEEGPVGRDVVELERRVAELLPAVSAVAAAVPGTVVEPKGFGVAVHYRGATDPVAARAALEEPLRRLADGAGLRVLEGKMVLELGPPQGPTKGDVVTRVTTAEGLRQVLYAGDDVADREAFAALDRLAGQGVEGVKVAVRSAETPEELVAEADLVVEGPAGLLGLLRDLEATGSR
jgi:trehalose 6-phosphate phosphatase